MPVPASELIPAIVVIGIAATFQGVVGIGFNVLAVPILILIDPVLAPAPSLILAIPLTIWQLLRERGEVDQRGVWWIVAGRFPGAFLGLWLLLVLSDTALEAVIAVIVLSAVALVWRGVPIRRTRATGFGTGVLSGVTGIVGAIGGPPVALLYRDVPPRVLRATVGLVFSIGIVLSVGVRAIGGEMTMDDLRIALALLPAMLIGFALSGLIKDRVPADLIRNAILVVSAVASLVLLAKALI